MNNLGQPLVECLRGEEPGSRWKAPGLKPNLTFQRGAFYREAFVRGLFTCYRGTATAPGNMGTSIPSCAQFSSNTFSSKAFRPIHSVQSYQIRLGYVRLGLNEMDWTKIFGRKDVGQKWIGRKVGLPYPIQQSTMERHSGNTVFQPIPILDDRLDFNHFPTNPTLGYTDWDDIWSHNLNDATLWQWWANIVCQISHFSL